MEAGSIVSWDKSEGDELSEGDLMAQIETDKATMEFETPEEGFLAKIMIPAGTKDVPIGKLLCIIVPNQEDVAKFANYVPTEEGGAPQKAPVSIFQYRNWMRFLC
jgi:pyruvate dehydrogenase E2 component (dihydrolipoamide acetyltransferase)